MKIKELRCPKCGSNFIEEDDCIETYSFSVNNGVEGLKEYYCGHCVDCGTHFLWSKVYEFSRYDDIEEDE